MCLAVPSEIVELHSDEAVVRVGEIRRRCNVAFIPDARGGDYVLLHAGFFIHKLQEDDIREYNEIMQEMEEKC